MAQHEEPLDYVEFEVDSEGDGERLDKVIVAAMQGRFGRSKVRELFTDGAVFVDGRHAIKSRLARAGEQVRVMVAPDAGRAALPNPSIEVDVCLEREDVVVVRKPAGQATAPVREGESDTLANGLVARYPEMASVGYSPREPGILHRLDNDTSGLVVAARRREAFEHLLQALRSGQLHKRYVLICAQHGLADTGIIEIPLCPHPRDRRRVLACTVLRDQLRFKARPASTSYRVLSRGARWALVEATASRAARHQIRAHFACIGHPLAGDGLYGGEPGSLGRQALHASAITWSGSAEVRAFAVEDDIPAELQALLATAAAEDTH
jgi:23S rRNA pseudouridine1911/1915/1917 synthase